MQNLFHFVQITGLYREFNSYFERCDEDSAAFAEHTIQCRIHWIIVILRENINHFQDIFQTIIRGWPKVIKSSIYLLAFKPYYESRGRVFTYQIMIKAYERKIYQLIYLCIANLFYRTWGGGGGGGGHLFYNFVWGV